ncbi:MAG: hypothetical protein ACO3N7_06775 [Kiritimatiellia bacterium]
MMKLTGLILLSAFLFGGCATRRANFQVNVGNGSPQLPIQNVELELDGKVQGEFKVIAPNKMAAAKPMKGDLPETLTVRWKDPEGNAFEQTLQIDATTRPDFTGQLVLEVSEQNVLTLTEVPSNGTELSTLPWAMPEAWEGSVMIPGMEGN